ncbi:RNA-directed DNA polymerase, eukaryota, reverse transcriptase zinc-binding domain protein [Tanacetum coccineum]
MTDLGSLNCFLGKSVTRDSSGMFLSQRKYATEIFERAGMLSCNSSRTPIDTESKLGDDGDPVSDPMLYRSLSGSLQYLIFTLPNISYAIHQVCLYMHDPREPHFSALKRILRYVREPEYHGVANDVAETCWLRNLLRELHTPLSSATLVYYDNVNLVAAGQVRVLHAPSSYQYADIFTKGLPSALFEEFRTSLSVRCRPTLTAGESCLNSSRASILINGSPTSEFSIKLLLKNLSTQFISKPRFNGTDRILDLIFKVDFEKAFDSISWNYLIHILDSFGFGNKWCSWIKACLNSLRASILINGSPTSEFSIKRGLRQGDPLSLFLFILVMEGLHNAFEEAVGNGLITGVNIKNSTINVSHLFYADDVIITTDWNAKDMDNIIRVLHVFYLASGLKINIHKSNIYGIGVNKDEVLSMASNAGCIAGDIPFNYLGLPIGSNMKSIASWKTLVDRFHMRLSSWKANLLSIGGRLTLIKSVLGSLGIYYLSIFRAPESVLQDLERIRAKFFWGGNKDKNKMAWVKWPIILNSFDKGGLNIGSLKAFNLALLQKWRWRLLSSPNALWVQVIKAYHGQEGGFDTNGCSFKGIWANIVGTSNFLHSKGIILSNTFRFKAGCGTRIRFWKDIWVGETPLFTRYNRLYHLDQDKDCLIIDRINNGQWSWNWSRTNLGVRNLAYLCDMLNEIGQLNIDVNEDTCTWSLGPNGTFTVKDARYRIDQNILPTLAHATTWDKSIPRKVNVFMWRLSLDRLPHRLNLSSRGMDIPAISCPSCNANVESANHVFFECDIATDMWKLVFRWCDIPLFQASSWDSFNDWIISWHASKEKKHRFYVITTSVLWWLWRYRNSVTFNSQPLRKSDLFDNVRFSSFSWLHNRDHMKLSWNDWLIIQDLLLLKRIEGDGDSCRTNVGSGAVMVNKKELEAKLAAEGMLALQGLQRSRIKMQFVADCRNESMISPEVRVHMLKFSFFVNCT